VILITKYPRRPVRVSGSTVFQLAKDLMEVLYRYKVSRYKVARLSYEVVDGWDPTKSPYFKDFVEVAEYCEKLNITAIEYLSSIVSFRRQTVVRTSLTEASLKLETCLEALEIYLFNKRESNQNYIVPEFLEISRTSPDPDIENSNQQYTWDYLLARHDHDVSKTLSIILTTDMLIMFRDSFLVEFEEYKQLKNEGKVFSVGDKITYLGT